MMFDSGIFITKIKQMDNEVLLQKIENQQKVISELTSENEQLFHQFNHLMVRNGKLLKRIDDMQQIIDSMHLRIEESQLINDNMLKLNDTLRQRNDNTPFAVAGNSTANDNIRGIIDTIHRRIDELHLRNDLLQQRTSILSVSGESSILLKNDEHVSSIDAEKIYNWWRNYPGQHAKNAPNLRKQSQMLVHLFENKSLNAASLFQKTGVNGVTGARYVAVLKQFGLIEYKGARKKGEYFITQKGIDLINKSQEENEVRPEQLADNPSQFESAKLSTVSESPDL